jgi:uncharacterized membrane protein
VFVACFMSLVISALIPSYNVFWWAILAGLVLGALLEVRVAPSGVSGAVALLWAPVYAWLSFLNIVQCALVQGCGPCVPWFNAAGATAVAIGFALAALVRGIRSSRQAPPYVHCK